MTIKQEQLWEPKPLAKALINEFGSFAGVMGADENALMCFSGLKENSVLIFYAL